MDDQKVTILRLLWDAEEIYRLEREKQRKRTVIDCGQIDDIAYFLRKARAQLYSRRASP